MSRKKKGVPATFDGAFLIDKPVGPTSRQVVDRVAKRLRLFGAGHCGTLDPLASGLLIVVAGAATRLQDLLTGHRKVYEAEVFLGAESTTDDAEGEVSPIDAAIPPTRDAIERALTNFCGVIDQRPPQFSAIHVDGQRSHELARRGEGVELPTRKVTIHAIDILDYEYPKLSLRVDCGAGTYIRSLARDLGASLACGGYLTALRRTASGPFSVVGAQDPDAIQLTDGRSLEDLVRGAPAVTIVRDDLTPLLQGRALPSSAIPSDDEFFIWCESTVLGRGIPVGDGFFRLRRLFRPITDQGRS